MDEDKKRTIPLSIIKGIGMLICIVLAVGLAILSLNAGEVMYMVYLMIAGLLGILAGVIKNIGQ